MKNILALALLVGAPLAWLSPSYAACDGPSGPLWRASYCGRFSTGGGGGGTTWNPKQCSFYVAPSGGSDSNPGTRALPFATIGKIHAAVQAAPTPQGKVACLKAGTYAWTALILTQADGGETWQSDPASGVDTAILDGGNTVGTMIQTDGDNLTIDGLTIRQFTNNGTWHDDGSTNINNLTVTNNDIGFNTATGTFQATGTGANGVNGALIANNYIHDLQAQGVTFNAFQTGLVLDNVVIDSNVVLRTGQGINDVGAIYTENPGSNGGGGAKATPYISSSIKITNNFVRDHGGAGIVDAHDVYLDLGSNHTTISGNILGPVNTSTGQGSSSCTFSDGFNNTVINNVCDVGASATMWAGDWWYESPPGFTITGLTFTNNLVLSHFAGNQNTSAFGFSGFSYVQTQGAASAYTITGNLYHNYAGGQERTDGPIASDGNPVHADPLCTGYLYSLPSTSAAFSAPVSFADVSAARSAGPPGFVIPTSSNHSCPG